MDKPNPIKEVFVHLAIEHTRPIVLTATLDAKEDFEEFGEMYKRGSKYDLFVGGHYDFQEVLDYIKSKE